MKSIAKRMPTGSDTIPKTRKVLLSVLLEEDQVLDVMHMVLVGNTTVQTDIEMRRRLIQMTQESV